MASHGWILIDGYNLVHAAGVFGDQGRTSLESAREALLQWLAERLSSEQRERTTIVFDGRDAPPGLPRSSTRHRMRIRFAPRNCEADDILEELIGQHSSPRALTVVSSDHRLHRAARRRRATPVDSDQWAAQLHRQGAEDDGGGGPKIDRDAPLAPEEVDYWLREFGEDG